MNKNDKIIISLTGVHENIQNIKKIINSITSQNVSKEFYEILLILSINEYKNIKELPGEIILLTKMKRIKILFVYGKMTYQRRTLITMKKYKNNPILIINNKCLLPNGWLKMFLNDHFKYPNDAIAASIQYYFGKACKITEFTEGFKGEKFGTFNHVTEMIFNFALVNCYLGGILYPKNFFQNSMFYDYDLFLKLNISEEFWQSAFIIIEDKILRQSSRIFDFTRYLINDINYDNFFKKRKKLLEKERINFIKTFNNFNQSIKSRQSKIIVSITSYPERFVYLPDLMSFIKNQTFHINKIIFFIYKEDMKYFNLSLENAEIISTDKDLKPHLKYFYAMNLYREYAIITLDDDIGYAKDTFKSLYKAYLDNPNIISGRRSHLMTYKNNGELKGYFDWYFQQKIINDTDFNLILTNVGGSIFPPDILNINEKFLPIIYETITCDDLTLKYFANLKGIPPKWIFNTRLMGIKKSLLSNDSKTLFQINHIYNDICINKLNIIINKFFFQNLCVPYRDIPTGSSIFLFDIHNRRKLNNLLYFELFAYSYCPIDYKINFTIYFGNYTSHCFINENKTMLTDFKNTSIAYCVMEVFHNKQENIDDYYFPSVISNNNIIIKIYNYRKYLTIIFKDFICLEVNNCILYVILLEEIYLDKIPVIINDKNYLCYINKNQKIFHQKFPILKELNCTSLKSLFNQKKVYISGIPDFIHFNNKNINNYTIPNIFIISELLFEKENLTKQIIINGKLFDNPKKDTYKFFIRLIYPKHILKCTLMANSKFVQSRIFCIINIEESELLIENQIVYTIDGEDEILLINKETFIKIKINEDNNYIEEYIKFSLNKKKIGISIIRTYILIFLIMLIKNIYHFL